MSGVDDATGEPEFALEFQVIGPTGMVLVEVSRYVGDLAGHPIGRFQMPISSLDLQAIRRAADASDFSMREPTWVGKAPFEAITEYTCLSSGRVRTKRVDGFDPTATADMEGLTSTLDPIVQATLKQPFAAIRTSLHFIDSSKSARLRVELTNVGKQTVAIRPLAATSYVRYAGFQIKRRGISPQWKLSRLAAAPGLDSKSGVVRLVAGESISALTVDPLSSELGATQIAQAVFWDYVAVTSPLHDYGVRGACFSETLKYVATR